MRDIDEILMRMMIENKGTEVEELGAGSLRQFSQFG
jgi:hypothetical protein